MRRRTNEAQWFRVLKRLPMVALRAARSHHAEMLKLHRHAVDGGQPQVIIDRRKKQVDDAAERVIDLEEQVEVARREGRPLGTDEFLATVAEDEREDARGAAVALAAIAEADEEDEDPQSRGGNVSSAGRPESPDGDGARSQPPASPISPCRKSISRGSRATSPWT